MDALLLRDAAYVNARYREVQERRRQQDARAKPAAPSAADDDPERSRRELEHWHIVQRAIALHERGPTPQLIKKFVVLDDILERLYAPSDEELEGASPSKGASSRLDASDANAPVPFKELPLPTQIALKMFFRVCQSLRDPAKLAGNCRLSVQTASKLPGILTVMPSCVLSPGLVDDATTEPDRDGVWSVFRQLFLLFGELLGVSERSSSQTEQVCLSASDRATVIVAYVALSLKWGRLGYLLKGMKLLLESGNEMSGACFEPLRPLFHDLATAVIERPQVACGEEDQPCGYLMSFGKGDHGKLGHGQCTHLSCQEGNCTENKTIPTMIAATRDILFRKIDSLSTHSIAITTKGDAMAWGNGDKYRLGHGSSAKEYTPRAIEFLSVKGRVRDLACGLGHTLALMESGDLYAWGNGSNGRLGVGDTNDRSSPTKVVVPTSRVKEPTHGDENIDPAATTGTPVRFRHIFCGASHSMGVSWDGKAYSWGKNNQGQCGHGHTNDQWTIQEIESFHEIDEVGEEECVIYAAGGWEHTLFCTASGRVYSCGCGYKDSRRAGIPPVLGHGDCNRRLKPTIVQALEDAREDIVKVACGWDHSLAVSATGRVYTWGSGTNGKLGHGDEESCDTPTIVRSMDGRRVKDAKAGCEHTVLLTHDHELWSCGQGDSGRLGHGENQTRKRPTKIELFAQCGLKPVALAVGDKYNLVLVTDGENLSKQEREPETSIPHPTYRMDHGVAKRAAHLDPTKLYNCQHKRGQNISDVHFGSSWVLSLAARKNPDAKPAINNADGESSGFVPSSVRDTALFILGHMDRLATAYTAEECLTEAVKRPAISAQTKSKDLLLPFAADTACESLHALLKLLRWALSSMDAKEKLAKSERGASDYLNGQYLTLEERMGLALSCLRVLQLNLKKAMDVSSLPSRSISSDRSCSSLDLLRADLFNDIHELLDSLAGLMGEDFASRFYGGNRCYSDNKTLSALGISISEEAACALKMGFAKFYPTALSRCSLLWEISSECEVDVPSMRTVILSDQLCKDAIMSDVFRNLYSHGSSHLTNEMSSDTSNEVNAGHDIQTMKTLLLALLKRNSAEAISHLDDDAFVDFTHEPDCFLRLLHALQTHYFSMVHRFVFQRYRASKMGDLEVLSGSSIEFPQILDALLDYLECLLVEALLVLKKLHKGSRQHEEIITWRLNGSFFHRLLPSAVECISTLLIPAVIPDKSGSDAVRYADDKMLLVERILPSLHAMLKMLDEVSWKMHSAGDSGNQAHYDSTMNTLHQQDLHRDDQLQNWFVELGDACAILCGKLSCELLYPSRAFHMLAQNDREQGAYFALVVSEGRLLSQVSEHDALISKPMRTILEWERLGVFEVEDEFVGCEMVVTQFGSTDVLPASPFESQHFLAQLIEADYPKRPKSFWRWVAANLSFPVDSHDNTYTSEVERLLTIVASVASWHLGLTEEFRLCNELYSNSSDESLATGTYDTVHTGRIWSCFSTLLNVTKSAAKLHHDIDRNAIKNAIATSLLLLKLQPNPDLMPYLLQERAKSKDIGKLWTCTNDFVIDIFQFLCQPVDLTKLQRTLNAKEVDIALSRTGICILHDLLRKLTTSSVKSYLLDEFVSVICTSYSASPTASALKQRIGLGQQDWKRLKKTVENLYVRLARIISGDDASFELKKRALIAWTVPLSTDQKRNSNVVGLIAKSGIMSTLVDLVLDEANILDTHSEINSCIRLRTKKDSVSDTRMPTKLAPVKTLLFSQTPCQTISFLAWEAFSAISMQLGNSEIFAKHRLTLFLRDGGLSLHDKEPLTPRNLSMSPRRRLTLPKKTIILTIDEIIDQMMDGLFLTLKKADNYLDSLSSSTQKLSSLLIPSASLPMDNVVTPQLHNCSRAFLLGCPVHFSQSSACEIGRAKSQFVNDSLEGATGLTLSFWLFAEQTGTVEGNDTPSGKSIKPVNRLNSPSTRLLAFGSGKGANSTTESVSSGKDFSLIVFIHDADLEYGSLDVLVRCAENEGESWHTAFLGQRFPREKWIHVAVVFDSEAPDHSSVFVDGKFSKLSNNQPLPNEGLTISSEILKNAASWTQLTVGGNLDVGALTKSIRSDEVQNDSTTNMELSMLSSEQCLNSFSGILDDVVIFRGALSKESIAQIRGGGTNFFRLKQLHIAENHCTNVLWLLCQLVGDENSDQSPLTRATSFDRWIALFTRMLMNTCGNACLSQIYLCYLLQRVLPQAPLLPELNMQTLAQSLFSAHATNPMTNRWNRVEDLIDMFNSRTSCGEQHTLSSSAWKLNEALWRLLQQHGMMGRRFTGGDVFNSTDPANETSPLKLTSKAKMSLKFATSVQMLQKLCATLSWASQMHQFIASTTNTFRSLPELEQLIQNESDNRRLSDLSAVVSTIAGYSEDVLNDYRAFSHDRALLPSVVQACNAPFSSVYRINEMSLNQAKSIQALIIGMLKEDMRMATCLSARNDLLIKFQNDVAAINAIDKTIGTVLHLRSRSLRFLMTVLVREQQSTKMDKTWHHFAMENQVLIDDLLCVAASYTKDHIISVLGPDAKTALKLRRLRIFIKEVLRGRKNRLSPGTKVSLLDLERLQWWLWEESMVPHSTDKMTPWWQQNTETSGKLILEVVGGDVELLDLKVKALEHFPTVRLSQANICANSGLWYYEVVVLTDGLMQIGYVDGNFTADPLQGQGVGDHTNSWAFDGFRCKKWNVNSYDYGVHWRADDVVGVLLDTDRMEISYFLNGKFLGVAFSGVPITASSKMCPAASLNVHQSAHFNFGAAPVVSTNEDESQPVMGGDFQHLPILDNDEDQTRLRPVMYALENRRTTSAGASTKTPTDEVAKINDPLGDWDGSSSDSDTTEDGEIALESPENQLGIGRSLTISSRDGGETRTGDQTDGSNAQRRRDLVEGLTGLGFPLEWATRCASETRLPMDETGAVTWILEQMEKVGIDGATIPPGYIPNDEGNDGIDGPGQLTAPLSMRMPLPDLAIIQSVDDGSFESSAFTGGGLVSSSENNGGSDSGLTLSLREAREKLINFSMPNDTAAAKLDNVPRAENVFLEAEKDNPQNDDTSQEAFPPDVYKKQRFDLLTETLLSDELATATESTPEIDIIDKKRDVDDLIPLRISVDASIFVAYARHAFVSLLLLASYEEEQEAVYKLVQTLLNDDSSARFYRFLRLALGLDTMDVVFEFGSTTDIFSSERSVQLQQALISLLQFEVEHADLVDPGKSTSTLSSCFPFFVSLCEEMMLRCDRAVALKSTKQDNRSAMESLTMQSAAVWFAWVSELVLRFLESRVRGDAGPQASLDDVLLPNDAEATRRLRMLANVTVSPFHSTSYLEKLILIASGTLVPWKYVAFRLISRVLFVVRSCEHNRCPLLSISADKDIDESGSNSATSSLSAFFVAAQLANLAELFTLRHRREMYNRVFFSDLTSALFSLLVRSSELLNVDRIPRREKGQAKLHVNTFSSNQASISWDHSCTADSTVTLTTDFSNTTAEGGGNGSTESKSEGESTIVVLEVKRHGQNFGMVSSGNDVILTKVLPSKGTYTVRNLLPDTQYLLRLVSLSDDTCDISNASSVIDVLRNSSVNVVTGLVLQTLPEPVFELDKESMGKNLVTCDQKLSAKNTVNKKWHSVRASVAFEEGVHQWQVRLDTCVSKNIFIGVCTAEASMENYIGSDGYGYGFLANKAVWHNKAKMNSYGEIFKQGDVIDVILDCNAKTLAFSRNGEYLGIAASKLRAGGSRSNSSIPYSNVSGESNCKWYPAFSMYNKDDKLTLVPPPVASMFQAGRPQNASTLELIGAMQDVLAYQKHLHNSGETDTNQQVAQLFEKAFSEFKCWKRGEMSFRETSLGQVIGIDTSISATDKYGLAAEDSVFTSKGQCIVIGEYRHKLWYEVDEVGSSSLYGATNPQISSWNLSACREMLASPDEYPVHRHHKYKLETDETMFAATEAEFKGSIDSVSSDRSQADALSVSSQIFADAQRQWGDSSVAIAEMDTKLMAGLDAVATSQALASPVFLSFSDISTALLLDHFPLTEKRDGDVPTEFDSLYTLARIGLLLYVNRCLYNVIRLAMPRNVFASSIEAYTGNKSTAKQQGSGATSKGTPSTSDCHQITSVAALLNSPCWTLEDPSTFTRISDLAARLLFSSQKERIIDEALLKTRTTSRSVTSLQETFDREDGEEDNDMPTIKVCYPLAPATPFWEVNPKEANKRCFRLPASTKTSIFVQLAKQLSAQDSREWRRESLQPFETIPISLAFQVVVEKVEIASCEGSTSGLEAEKGGELQQEEEDEEQQLQQPSSKQTAQYLQLFESAVREIQSPRFPLFTPVENCADRSDVESSKAIQLDINTELFSPEALVHLRVRRSTLLLWFYCFGQLLGIGWRSKLILPLQFLSSYFWEELASPAALLGNDSRDRDRSRIRATAIGAIRDGLFSIIPSRCVDLLSGSKPGLRERLSDLDLGYVVRLERHAVYLVPRENHHDLFWKVLNAFSSVERRMLEQFVNSERRSGSRLELQVESIDESPTFVLEIAEALADGRDHPDSCYPVVVSVSPHSSRLHLPAYSTAQTLRHKLLLAMANIPFM